MGPWWHWTLRWLFSCHAIHKWPEIQIQANQGSIQRLRPNSQISSCPLHRSQPRSICSVTSNAFKPVLWDALAFRWLSRILSIIISLGDQFACRPQPSRLSSQGHWSFRTSQQFVQPVLLRALRSTHMGLHSNFKLLVFQGAQWNEKLASNILRFCLSQLERSRPNLD